MAGLKGAAPQSVVEHATIMSVGPDNKMKVVREGSNGWTCMDPGGAPMCADKAAMEWAKAWQEKGPAPQKTGFVYMLKGDAGTSNTDPYAKEETSRQPLGQDRTPRHDRGRSQGHDASLPEGPKTRPHQTLCHVALANSLRAPNVARSIM